MLPPPNKILYSWKKIQKRVAELGEEIAEFYDGKPIKVIGLMNGSLFFLVDLLRKLPADFTVETWRISSYEGQSSSGKVKGLEFCTGDFSKHNVLIVDDILDTGLTLHEVKEHLKKLGAKKIKVCVLLAKDRKRVRPIKADWVGFNIPDKYVIGYGFDIDGRFRALPYIAALKGEKK